MTNQVFFVFFSMRKRCFRICIGGNSTLATKFSKTCRDIISKDLTAVKLAYFKGRSKTVKLSVKKRGYLVNGKN